MKISQERYNKIKTILTDKELSNFEVVKEKMVDTRNIVGTSHIEDIYNSDNGEDQYIYESYDSGNYVVPVTVKGLDAAKKFVTDLFGSY